MSKFYRFATILLIVALLLAALPTQVAQAAGPGNGPGEPNRGESQPAHQGHAWNDPVVPPAVNPPSGGPAAEKVSAGVTGLLVTVWGDADADGVRDLDEVGLEDVIIVLKTEGGFPVRFSETGVDGQVVFLDLVAGAYVLDVRPQAGWSPALVSTTVVAGQTTVIEVGLKPASTGG